MMSNDSYLQLRKYIKAEDINIPRPLLNRSVIKISLYALTPHGFIFLSLLLYQVWMPEFKYLPIYFILFLASQRCFQTLVHDSSHYLFSKNINLNDMLANFIVAGWIGSTIQAYRTIHFKHHKYNGSAMDPEYISFTTIKQHGGLLIYIIRYIFCLEVIRLFHKYYLNGANVDQGERGKLDLFNRLIIDKLHIYCSQLLLFLLFAIFGSWYLYLLWLYVAVSWSPMISGLRFLVEHPEESDKTVTTKSWFLEKLYFAPFNFNYHYEHHVWPSLPPYRLVDAHAYLNTQRFFERHPEYLNKSFIGSLWKN